MEGIQAEPMVPPTPKAPSRWRSLASRTLPLRYPLIVLAVVTLVTVGQLVEDALDTPTLEMLNPGISIPRWTLALLTLYMLVMLRLIQRTSVKTLRDIRATVKCDDQAFDAIRQRMTRVPWRTDIGLALAVLAIVVLVFPILHSSLPVVRHPATNELTYLPADPLNAALVLVAYWLFGWSALSLLVNAVRLGAALGDLTQMPLALDVYHTENVLPLGRLALVLSLAPAGVVLILLMGLGTPTGPLSWLAFLLASAASVLALVLPLRGVHRQMSDVKHSALWEINTELSAIQRQILDPSEPDAARTAQLANRTSTLINLRKVVQEGPTWPFQDSVAVSRAVLVASAPLIYAVLNELIQIFLITPLTK